MRRWWTYSTRASLAGVPLTCRHFVLSLLGLIARPVGAGVDELDGAEEVLDEVDEVDADEEAEAEEEGGEPELSC